MHILSVGGDSVPMGISEFSKTIFGSLSDINEDNTLKLFVENEMKTSFTWWNQEAISWLPKETLKVKDTFAYGVLTSVKTYDYRLKLIKHWYIQGMNGCIMFMDADGINKQIEMKLKHSNFPNGLIPCSMATSDVISLISSNNDNDKKPSSKLSEWIKKSPQRARVSLAPIVLFNKYPHASWYLLGDDDTMFSPLALAQWLSSFDESDKWYAYSIPTLTQQ